MTANPVSDTCLKSSNRVGQLSPFYADVLCKLACVILKWSKKEILHMVHRTSCLSSDRQTGSTLDKLQFHSSVDDLQTKLTLFYSFKFACSSTTYCVSCIMHLNTPTSCSHILTITLAVAVSLWFPKERIKLTKTILWTIWCEAKNINFNNRPALTSIINDTVV